MISYKFAADNPGDMSAGIWSYSDDVTITVDSGNPGGEDGEFANEMRDALSDWFDGANVTLISSGHVKSITDMADELAEAIRNMTRIKHEDGYVIPTVFVDAAIEALAKYESMRAEG